MITKAEANRNWKFEPRSPTRFTSATVIGSLSVRNTEAIKKSFQVHRNWNTAKAASAGRANGSTKRMKIVKWLAPSMRAASNTSRGSWLTKLCNSSTANGKPKAVCVSHTAAAVLAKPTSGSSTRVQSRPGIVNLAPLLNNCNSGTNAIWLGKAIIDTSPMNSQLRPRNSIQANP